MNIRTVIPALKILGGLGREEDQPPRGIVEEKLTYPGPEGETVPYRSFNPAGNYRQTVIIFPGASPFAEDHPGLIKLGRALAAGGITAIAPRIPPLKILQLREDIQGYFIHFYHWYLDKHPGEKVSTAGLSYGGSTVMSMVLDTRMGHRAPSKVLVYGTYCNLDTALDFLLTGEIPDKEAVVKLPTNTWAIIVMFHNFLNRVDPGYPIDAIARVLKLRVAVKEDEALELAKTLGNPQRDMLLALLLDQPHPEITRLIHMIVNTCREELVPLSPNAWCSKLQPMIFLMHGTNDAMVPYTESILLSEKIPNNRLLISQLYKHREQVKARQPLVQLRELYKMVSFLSDWLAYR